ncbi:hypothetical protein ABTL00_19600, partial [Acinetobacter baumannii]
MQRLNRVAIAISLSTFVLTGCGGGSDDTAATTPPAAPAAPAVSVADYVVPKVQSCAPTDTPETALQGQ